MSVENLISEIEMLQKKTNDAIVKKETEISKKASIDQEVEDLQNKCKEKFGCEIKELIPKKEELEKIMIKKISELKQILNLGV